MNVSIVVPYHSNRNLLDACLRSLLKTVPDDVEIILVQNNADASKIGFEVESQRVRSIIIPKNLGYSKAINLGVAEARGEVLILSDADSFYMPGWYTALLADHTGLNPYGMTSAKLLNPLTGRIIDFGMGLTTFNNAHPFKDMPADHTLVSRSRQVQMACSACMMITREAFDTVGGMDEDLYNFYQDTDLCLRLNEAGYSVFISEAPRVFHQGDSAETNRSAYRADVKGVYYGKNMDRMHVDMHKYFDEAFQHLRQQCNFLPKYAYINCSTVADYNWYQEVILQYFRLDHIGDFSQPHRDSDRLNLLSLLPHNALQSAQPNIYFIDRYVSLITNVYWRHLREGRGDLVIDRNANMVELDAMP